jgi:hypothetical protein
MSYEDRNSPLTMSEMNPSFFMIPAGGKWMGHCRNYIAFERGINSKNKECPKL